MFIMMLFTVLRSSPRPEKKFCCFQFIHWICYVTAALFQGYLIVGPMVVLQPEVGTTSTLSLCFYAKKACIFFFLQTHGCIHTWTLLRFPLGSVRKDKILSNQKARCYHCQGKGVVSHSVCLTSALTVCGVQERECGWQGFHLPLPPPVAPCPSQLTVSVFTLDYMRKIVFSPSDSLSWLSYG